MSSPAIRRLVLFLGATLALACGGDSGTGPNATISGTYALSTYNGKTLPFTVTETVGTDTYTITYAAPFNITLNQDNTMKIVSTGTFTFNGVTEISTDSTRGTYTVTGNKVNFNTFDGDFFTADWNGSDQLTISEPPDVLVFRKQ